MNSKAWITLFLFLGWVVFSWYWVYSRKEGCCPLKSIPLNKVVSSKTFTIPIYYTHSSAIPQKGSNFEPYKQAQLAEMGPFDTLVISGWYFSNETNSDSLARKRAENLAPFFKDLVGSRIKLLVEKHNGNMDPNSEGFEAASLGIIHKPHSLVQKIKDKILIYFPVNSSAKKMDPEIENYLDTLSLDIKSRPPQRVEVVGYTDNTGDNVNNLKLSKKRADFVKNKLKEKGVDSNRIVTLGLGSAHPIAPNTSEEARRRNRRVELTILNH